MLKKVNKELVADRKNKNYNDVVSNNNDFILAYVKMMLIL